MPQKTWTKQTLIEQLQDWTEQGVPVAKLWQQDRKVTLRSVAVFGSWRAALSAAGLKSSLEQWSRRRILHELRQRCGNRQTKDRKLEYAAKRYFGSVHQAKIAAGLPVKSRPLVYRDWTRQDVLVAIGRRVADGKVLRATCREDPALYAAAKHFFGNWTEARKAAGFPIVVKEHLTPEEVMRRIKSRHGDKLPLSNLKEIDQELYRSARRWFGSMTAAVRASGLELRASHRWSKQRIVQAMQRRHSEGAALCRTWREDRPLFRAAVNWFGGWQQAMRAAGFEPIRRQRWTRQGVVERIQAWHQRTLDTSLSTSDPNLAAAARSLFGTLDAALKAADIEPRSRLWTDERVIASIQERYIHGQPKHIQGLGDIRLANAAKRRFGSWANAVQAAGLTNRVPIAKPLKRWSQGTVVQAIQQAVSDGIRLSDISKVDQGLYNAAKTHFGTWGEALKAAGAQPRRRKWSKQAIIAEIRHRRSLGQTLASGHPSTIALAGAAWRYFGSWSAALAAASARSIARSRKAAS
jgi:hypothetical protein